MLSLDWEVYLCCLLAAGNCWLISYLEVWSGGGMTFMEANEDEFSHLADKPSLLHLSGNLLALTSATVLLPACKWTTNGPIKALH